MVNGRRRINVKTFTGFKHTQLRLSLRRNSSFKFNLNPLEGSFRSIILREDGPIIYRHICTALKMRFRNNLYFYYDTTTRLHNYLRGANIIDKIASDQFMIQKGMFGEVFGIGRTIHSCRRLYRYLNTVSNP